MSLTIGGFRNETPLFGGGLSLDSVSGLELLAAIEEESLIPSTRPEPG